MSHLCMPAWTLFLFLFVCLTPAVEELGAALVHAVYHYNTEIASRQEYLPFVESIRLAPLPVSADDSLTRVREKEEEERDEATALSFFNMPDDAPVDETLALSRAQLRGMSRAYVSLRKLFLEDCEKQKQLSVGRPFQGIPKKGTIGHLRITAHDEELAQPMKLTDSRIKCMRFPLPVLDLAYNNLTSFAAALKAEEEAANPAGV